MKKGSFLWFTAVALSACTGISVAQQGKVRQELWEKVKAKGVVRVLVQLNVPTKPLGTLNKEEAVAQQNAISVAQNEVLAELNQTKYKVGRLFENIPAIALEVGPDALTVLERSIRVTKVTEERVFKPFQQ